VLEADRLFPGHGQDLPNPVGEVVVHSRLGLVGGLRYVGRCVVQ
jgi:hypothetical protein